MSPILPLIPTRTLDESFSMADLYLVAELQVIQANAHTGGAWGAGCGEPVPLPRFPLRLIG